MDLRRGGTLRRRALHMPGRSHAACRSESNERATWTGTVASGRAQPAEQGLHRHHSGESRSWEKSKPLTAGAPGAEGRDATPCPDS